MKNTFDRPQNRAARREKTIRTAGYKPKAWIRVFATTAILGLFVMAILAGVLSK